MFFPAINSAIGLATVDLVEKNNFELPFLCDKMHRLYANDHAYKNRKSTKKETTKRS
jgi:hypothetical protein